MKSEVAPWIKFFNYYLAKYGVAFLQNVPLQKSIFKGKTLALVLKDIYLNNKSSDFIMYGNSIFTTEHITTDGGYPDQIYVRPNWYILYLKNLSWLISEKFKLDNSELDMQTFSRMVNFVSKNKCSMKGIIDYEIARKLNKKVFDIPVFYSSGDRLLALADATMFNNYQEKALEVLKNTEKYMHERGLPLDNIKIEEKIEYKSNGSEYYIGAFKITLK